MEIVDAQKFLKENHRACISVRQKDKFLVILTLRLLSLILHPFRCSLFHR